MCKTLPHGGFSIQLEVTGSSESNPQTCQLYGACSSMGLNSWRMCRQKAALVMDEWSPTIEGKHEDLHRALRAFASCRESSSFQCKEAVKMRGLVPAMVCLVGSPISKISWITFLRFVSCLRQDV